VRLDLVRRLRALGQDSAARWGRMSAHQMVCHLRDACHMAMGHTRVQAMDSRRGRTLIKWVALYLPVRWPQGIPTLPELDQRLSPSPGPGFAADVDGVVALLEEMAGKDRSFVWPPHPIFGPMSRAAWLRWGWLHADHHLRQFGA
jgi:hypothetical protein